MSSAARELLTARLSNPVASTARVSADNAEWRERREKAELEECTFRPNLSCSAQSYMQRSLDANASTGNASFDGLGKPGSASEVVVQPYQPSDCVYQSSPSDWAVARNVDTSVTSSRAVSSTNSPRRRTNDFAPKTNAVPSTMHNARAYLREDVFSRLTRTPEAPATGGSRRGDFSQDSVLSSGCGSAIGRCLSDTCLGDNSAVQSFIQRQEALEEERQARLAQLESESAPSHRPELNGRSVQLAERRLARGKPKLERGASTGAIDGKGCGKTPAEAGCTFKPKITAKARDRQPRSIEQLSTGDKKYRDDRVEQMRKQAEKDQTKGLTFSPHVNNYNGIVGRLRVREAPDTLLERMDQHSENVAKRCSLAAKQSRAKEEAACTFAPAVRQAPDFVRCMAESYRMLRAHREKENQQDGSDAACKMPEWR